MQATRPNRPSSVEALFAAVLASAAFISGEKLAAQSAEGVSSRQSPAPSAASGEIPPTPVFEYKVGARLFLGYEFEDSDSSGRADQRGPNRQDSGFGLERAFLTFDGKVNEGVFKDWTVSITSDLASAAELADGCGGDSVCDESNEYAITLRQAYIDIPLPVLDGLSVRMGQIESAMGQGAAGYRMTAIWENRYLGQRTHLQEAGLNEPVDRGVALIYKHDYGGLHAYLANGESFERVNAQEVNPDSLSKLGRGESDSYALEFQGLLHFEPTGKKNDNVRWLIGFPWRLHNISRVHEDEVRYFSANLTDPAAPDFVYLIGDSRAKRDVTYGAVTDLIITSGLWQINLGVGGAETIDRRANAYRVDQRALSQGLTQADFNRYVRLDSDAHGHMNYAWLQVRYGHFAVVGRWITQTQTDRLQRRLQTRSGKGWAQQMTELDFADGVAGNLTPNRARSSIDLGLGRVNNVVYAITYFPHPRSKFFRISLGVSELFGTDLSGRAFQRSAFDRYDGAAFGVESSLKSQLEASPATAAALGLPPGEIAILNDYVGREYRAREVFIRAEFRY